MNILILTAKYGMGHYSASISLKQELEKEDTNVEIVDFFEIVFPILKNVFYGMFNILVSKCGSIYNFFYKFTANTNVTPFKTLARKRVEKLIEDRNPDIIISTFPVCSSYISDYKKNKETDIKLYTYITDVNANKEWITDETDTYFVGSRETEKQLQNFDISKEKIKIVGIPVKEEFKIQEINKEKNEIVIMGGGLGIVPGIDNILNELLEKEDNYHITLITGKNKKIYKKYYNKHENLTVLGYTEDVYKYMKKANLVITKPGGITLFEAIYSKTPIYVIHPFLSQEIGNATFIETYEIGEVVWEKNKKVSEDIRLLLKTPSRLEKMRQNMQAIRNNLEKINAIDVYNQRSTSVC